MSSSSDTRVLIIGGGLGGLTLAAILRRIDIPCIVLERSAELAPAGAGISLAPNALRVLEQLGLYNEIARKGQRLNKMLVYYNEKQWRTLDFTGLEALFGYPVYSIERYQFNRILYEAAGREECVRWSSKVEDIIDDPVSDRIFVKVAGGKEYTADVVVGADGIRSITRRILAQNAGLDSINTIEFTGRVHMSGLSKPMPNLGPEHVGIGNWLFYDDAILTTWPCKDNRQWFIGVKRVPVLEKQPNHSVWEGATPSTVNEVYGHRYHPFGENKKVEDIVNNTERVIASNVFEEKDFPSMTSGRVALLGDAAHSMTSFFGQGACQAIEDAAELANAFKDYYTSPNPTKASLQKSLTAYSTVRGARGKNLVSFSRIYAGIHVARLPYGLGPYARQVLFKWLPVWAWMWALDWLYGYQPTVKAVGFRQSEVGWETVTNMCVYSYQTEQTRERERRDYKQKR